MEKLRSWLDTLYTALNQEFNSRILLYGLQGSYRRGEATEDSDIDIVVILDALTPGDLLCYQKRVQAMPYHEKACGFICGKEELMAWPRCDSFHLYYDTLPLFGSFHGIVEPFSKQEAKEAAKAGAAMLYHAMCHTRVFGKITARALQGFLKSAFFILRAKQFAKTEEYAPTKRALHSVVNGTDREIMRLLLEPELILHSNGTKESFDKLFYWCKKILNMQ